METETEDKARYFELDRDSSVMLNCPDCEELLWLDSDEVPTLGDVIDAANAHVCADEDGQS